MAKWVLGVGFAAAALLPAKGEHEPSPDLAYASFVCWKYPQLPELKAWKVTEKILATALAESDPSVYLGSREENGSPQQLKDFLARLPDNPKQFVVVYLAAHQSPAGQWYFTDRTDHNWGDLMAELPKLPSTQRIVLLDCCYAASVKLWPGWVDKVAPACIYSSAVNEPTPDIYVFRRRPADWGKLFPKATAWLRNHHMDDPDLRVSFLGLIWLEAWLERPATPKSMSDWKDMAQSMKELAENVAIKVRSDACSSISSTFAPCY